MGQGRRLRPLATHAKDHGVALGTINSNTFQDADYKARLLAHRDDRIRRKAIDHHLECIDIMDATGSRDLKIWLADGTNYAGQDDMRGRQDRMHEALQEIYARIGEHQRLVLEYKIFEPAFYHMDVPDWGTSLRAGGRPRRPRHGVPRHRPPRPEHQHRVHRDAAPAPGQGSARSTSTRATTPTTTSSWAPPTPSNCSASSSR
ncbi:hypothetical protein GCM10025876_28170 [Demequina litorisediminis]|uniref:Uncharacterized protein n=1 Tax=Demequina litorisediminis TaxID=1849022 RepID=A0ABQ6IHI2_9MICO|nr:hypothetical protein GCM10025876_28170 [Demequina litorisediminis]